MADPQETQVSSLVINKLTKTQYQALIDAGTVSNTELYLVPDEGSTEAAWGNITGTLSNQTDLQTALNAKYDASNPSGYQTASEVATAISGKQDKLTAGANIQISDANVISATDTNNKVESTVSTADTNYPVLLNNGTTATTDTALMNTGVYANPSTGTIGAGKVSVASAVTLNYNSATEALEFVFA